MRNRVLALLLTATLAACDRGTLDLDIGDAPVDDADAIVVQFTGVVLEHENGQTEEFSLRPVSSIDLAAQREGLVARLLDGVNVQDGRYVAVQLKISATGSGTDSWVDVGADRRALVLDAADEGRLRIPTAFLVERRKRLGLTIDFDLRKSVLVPDSASAPYGLRPSLRVVETGRSGGVSGTVSAARAGASGCRPAVYLYAGAGATPDDEGSSGAPYASALVRAAGTDFFYRIAFLPPGSYTAAFTCEAAADDPETDDATTFSGAQDVTVAEDRDATADFP